MVSVTIIGNLTADPELRYVSTAKGDTSVCNFTIATNKVVNDKKLVNYFRVACWGKMAENAAKYLAKGSKVAVYTSDLTARAYQARDGELRAQIEFQAEQIEYLSSAKRDGQDNQMAQPQPAPMPYGADTGFMNIPDSIGDELPFS